MPKYTGVHFWKIVCLSCGVNCDLLTDKYKRVICRDCLKEAEFNEVESEIFSEGLNEEPEIQTKRPVL